MADQQNIIITAPEDPTHIHIPDNSTDVLDIALLKNIGMDYDIRTVHDLSSDHLPVILRLGSGSEPDEYITHKTSWKYFRSLTTLKIPIINTEQHLEYATIALEEHPIENYRKATTTTIQQRKPNTSTGHPTASITKTKNQKTLLSNTGNRPQNGAKQNNSGAQTQIERAHKQHLEQQTTKTI